MIAAPCKNCESRSERCHGRCEKYRDWAEDRRTELDLRMVSRQADEMQIEAIDKIKRKQRSKL